MARFCLPLDSANKFLESLKDGSLDVAKLVDMSSAERRVAFGEIVGESSAKEVNTKFETALISNQKTALKKWAERLAGLDKGTKTDILSKIEKLDTILNPETEKAFLEDLVASKLKVNVTAEEAKTITELANNIQESKKNMQPDFTFKTEGERLDYGSKQVVLNHYLADHKMAVNKEGWKAYLNPIKSAYELSALAKSLRATLDNSFFGRQGLKVLMTNPKEWSRSFAKSWKDIGNTLAGRGEQVQAALEADILSRPNALNGKYKDMGLAVGITEEAYPTSLPERIPLLGRLFKASEIAYDGGAQRMRADLADKFIAIREKQGIDLSTPENAKSLGRFINSLTGRGHLGGLEMASKELNVGFFSVKYLKSNFDTLTMHLLDKNVKVADKKAAAMNLAKIVGVTGGVLYLADKLWPGSVEWDWKSANAGKVKIGNTRFDMTGGMGSIVTLATRVKTMQSKSSISGNVTDLGSGFGQTSPWQLFEDFTSNKLSPFAQVVKDLINREDRNGNPISLLGELNNLATPLSIDNSIQNAKDPNSANLWLAAIADGLGFNVNTYGTSKQKTAKIFGNNVDPNLTREIDRLTATNNAPSLSGVENLADFKRLKTEKGDKVYNQAIKEMYTQWQKDMLRFTRTSAYRAMTDEEKGKALDSLKTKEQTKIFNQGKYKLKVEKKKPTGSELLKKGGM